MKLFQCTSCGHRIFFENVRCESCGARLGYSPGEQRMVSFAADSPDTADAQTAWERCGPEGPPLRPCANYVTQQVCNWMVPADDPSLLCTSCRTTSIIPQLDKPENRVYWAQLEQAKRRLFHTLLALKLPIVTRAEDPEHGLEFRFLEATPDEPRVLTGHDEGLITLNIAEADDARRERTRAAMHEPYRTLVGHFRHEIGHYYWDVLVAHSPWLDEYRQLFGDERADYAEALKKHYDMPMADWPANFISVYASSHPWEDWAECWAHYLHMVDGLETAAAWGLQLDSVLPGGPSVRPEPVDLSAPTVQASVIEQWLPVSQFCNAMNRSLGQHDAYPFVVPPPVVAKLDFIHKVVTSARPTAAEPTPQTSGEAELAPSL